jgi:RNA-binding protein Musashi
LLYAVGLLTHAPVDLYGEDDNEFVVPLQEGEDEPEETHEETPIEGKSEDKSTTTKSESSTQASPVSVDKADAHSLPAKPGPTSTSAEQMSYSAQIARQFSAYHQTPSQERQQRTEIPLPANPTAQAAPTSAGPSAIAIHETAARANPDRPIRPSEMKDEG